MRQSCNEQDKKIDVYAFAISLYEMVTRGSACKWSLHKLCFRTF